jgi:hypothetical protein
MWFVIGLGEVPDAIVFSADARQSSRNKPRIAVTADSVFITCIVDFPVFRSLFSHLEAPQVEGDRWGGSEFERAAG